jgi:hypothetical protein
MGPGAKKFDQGKTMWSAMPWDALNEVAEVFTFGATKYGERNYLEKPFTAGHRYFSAAMRHMVAVVNGTKIDEESGKHHLAHAVCCILMWLATEGKYDKENTDI